MNSPLYVVGIGASAGGLEALLPLLGHLPKTGRMAFVIAQHMAADGHADLMVSLLARGSALPVKLSVHGETLVGDQIYLLDSGQDGVVRDGTLCLRSGAPESFSHPSVNVLLESLAREFGPRAVGIILSGTGSDGVRGARAIRARGGLVLAQEPRSARYSAMPLAAIEAGVVDEVLGPQELAARLTRLFPDLSPQVEPPPPEPEPGLPLLLTRILATTGVDFRSYKTETLLRRLRGRQASLGLESLEAYLNYLDRHPDEPEGLAQHFLVSLSSFFRDREAFAVLEKALGPLLAGRPAVRIWVPGCASGEEVYSLAILVSRVLGADRRPVEILGEDLNPRALAVAEAAVYPVSAFKELEPELLAAHFTRQGEGYQVSECLRSMCRFQRRDVTVGEPPGELDLISCRNLLIYLQTSLQAQLMRAFHAALRPQGLLFIAPSETVGVTGHALFAPVDAEHKLYRRRSG